MIIVIGDIERWQAAGRALPEGEDVAFARPEEITAALIAGLCPTLILASLFSPGAEDAVDLARRLAGAGYRGPFRALTLPLPQAAMIRDEVAEAAPDLDFDLVILSGRLN